jgi:hypothetical protein
MLSASVSFPNGVCRPAQNSCHTPNTNAWMELSGRRPQVDRTN